MTEVCVIEDETAAVVVASYSGFLLRISFQGGRGAKSIVMQIPFVMLLFSDQISGRGKNFQRGANCLRGRSPAPLEESQYCRVSRNPVRFKALDMCTTRSALTFVSF